MVCALLRLWHQLSLALEAFVSKDDNIRGDNMNQVLFNSYHLSNDSN